MSKSEAKSVSGSSAASSPACIGDTGLKGAVAELHAQHPPSDDARGPHHTVPASRHQPLGGLRPCGAK
jgi:hypothetical protein